MGALTREARASVAFLERNFHLSRRYIGWEMVFLVYALVNTMTIGLIGAGDPSRVLYLVVGAMLWSFLSVLFHDVAESLNEAVSHFRNQARDDLADVEDLIAILDRSPYAGPLRDGLRETLVGMRRRKLTLLGRAEEVERKVAEKTEPAEAVLA